MKSEEEVINDRSFSAAKEFGMAACFVCTFYLNYAIPVDVVYPPLQFIIQVHLVD